MGRHREEYGNGESEIRGNVVSERREEGGRREICGVTEEEQDICRGEGSEREGGRERSWVGTGRGRVCVGRAEE